MIKENLSTINNRIRAAAHRVNRSPEDIKLVAVSKRVPHEKIFEAIDCGHLIFGENYVQEAQDKIPLISDRQDIDKVSFHFIGKLQSNKARRAAELFDVIETIDSLKLANSLENHLKTTNRTLTAYIQVNIGRENQKAGVMPDDCNDLLEELTHLQHLRIVGLMAMPPYSTDPEDVRPYFKKLRELSAILSAKGLLGQYGPVGLSMGMSGDFEVAIEEGATVIRIGTAIFGQR
jgi:pyridoxal phosphate enzyme (YggS family)